MNNRSPHLPYLLQLVLIGMLQSCRFLEIGVSDYPPNDRTKLKGPSDKTLETQIVRLTELVTYPFYGSTFQTNQQLLLFGHNEAAGRLALIASSGVSELPKSALSDVFVTPSGTIWGVKYLNDGFMIRQLINGKWEDQGTIDGLNYYKTVRITDQEIWFTTSKGLVSWDINLKKVNQLTGIDRSRVFTEHFSVESVENELTIFQNQNLKNPIVRLKIKSLGIKKGISNEIWGVFEDKNQHVWFVVKDADWDGILFKFDGKNLTKLTTIPVGNFDSGRSVDQYNLNKTGNLWVRIDGINYIYRQDGQWILPQFDLLKNTLYAGTVFTNTQGNLVIASFQKLYSINS
ncbi:hypothetical protein [Larkinella rosea]|uniref:Uncharacterized protein n=1 Tax=Larkinella rosea TaxID=2025312 RepID=A0A3P1C3R8_9BACT|nr:hypothetical protein [Larkinella rosea]RRB07676.1 hypothetical protein EHT25_07860 [Larkinella rosea]